MFLNLILMLATPVVHGAPPSCPPDSHWVKAYHRRSYIRADGTNVAASNISAHCAKNPPGFKSWDSKFRTDRPRQWSFANEQLSTWTEETQERVLEAIGTLPAVLRDVPLIGLFRMKRSVRFPNPASGDETGAIVLYDEAFSLKRNLARVLAHELAHSLYRTMPSEEAADYRDATFWWNRSFGKGDPIWTCLRRNFVEPDGARSPAEDFSNNIEYYLFNPEKLKGISRDAFNWIQSRLGDSFKIGREGP